MEFIIGNGVLHQGNTLEILKQLSNESVDTTVTSPPYWALRNYKTTKTIWDDDPNCEHEWENYMRKGMTGGQKSDMLKRKELNNFQSFNDSEQAFCKKCGAWRGDLGLEPTIDLYVKHLCDIFDQVKRILKPGGSCWVNIGDTYMNNSSYNPKGRQGYNNDREKIIYKKDKDVSQKSLCLIPGKFAIEMIKRGWILRNEIIWCKPNAMPSSIKDRFTVDYEKLFFFTKNKKYNFDQQFESATQEKVNKRNKRSVWNINTESFGGAHFAVFPKKLIEIPIVATCPEGGTVLDPFMGSGTTALVSEQLKRKWIGTELSNKYCAIIKERLEEALKQGVLF